MHPRPCSLLVFLTLSAIARAQCPDWVGEFTPGHADSSVRAEVVFDDGGGPALFLGGDFTRIGSTAARGVARYDGTNLSEVGGGLVGSVGSLVVLDVGTGPRLYATGLFTPVGSTPTSVARLDGNTWTPLGAAILGATGATSAFATCLAVYDFGAGPTLFVGGSFAGGFLGNGECVRRWNGASWVSLGSEGPGAHPFFFTPEVHALAVFDDGTGAKLYAGGRFHVVSGANATGVARWNGASWETVTLGTLNGPFGEGSLVTSLAVHDFGAGPRLHAAGAFVLGGATRSLAHFANGAWVEDSLAAEDSALRLASIAGSGGVAGGLYLLGSFWSTNPPHSDSIARWDGTQVHAVGTTSSIGGISSVASFDAGLGAQLFAAGGAGQPATGTLSTYANGAWSLLEIGNAPSGSLRACASIDDDGDGRASVYVGGLFPFAGNARVQGLARYDRGVWSNPAASLTSGFTRGLDVVIEGGAPVLYATGQFSLGPNTFTNVLRLAGSSVTAVGPSIGSASCVARFDPGTGARLWAGHDNGLAAWDGTSWTQPFVVSSRVLDLLTFDDGAGLALYGVGQFATAGGVSVPGLFRWNGTAVDALDGSGAWTLSNATCMTIHDDGSGAKLFVGGYFSNGGAPASLAIARRDGTSWTPVATSFTYQTPNFDPILRRLAVHEGANGRELVVGGAITSIEGVAAAGLASFDGTSWTALGSGLSSSYVLTVSALCDHDFGDGAGPDVVVTGEFQSAGGAPAAGLARYRACGDAHAFCFGDGTGTACPCGNVGASGHGCGNANFASGALLSVAGRAQVVSDTLTLVCTGISNGTPALFYQGTAQVNGGNGVVFGDGFACITGTLIRLGIRFTTNGVANFGAPVGPGAISTLGFVPGAGGTRQYGCRYRSDVTFCTHTGFSYSNAVTVDWAP